MLLSALQESESTIKPVTDNNFTFDLYNHQKKALSWICEKMSCKASGCILADDMGLGKTIVVAALINVISSCVNKINITNSGQKDGIKITLVVPLNILNQWNSEIQKSKCFGENTEKEIYIHRGWDRSNKNNLEKLGKASIILTTYETLVSDFKRKLKKEDKARDLFIKQGGILVFDECHRLKSQKSQATKVIQGIKREFVLCLSGTPINNTKGNKARPIIIEGIFFIIEPPGIYSIIILII